MHLSLEFDIINEVRTMDQFARLHVLIGDQFSKLEMATVLVVGLGGVGSYAVEALARSGIGHLILVDYDVIDETNLNRQLMTLHSNIGMLKTEVWQHRIEDIVPSTKVEIKNMKLNPSDIESLLSERVDFIIDACDDIPVKKELIRASIRHSIKLISSMGTGNKLDPTKLNIVELTKTNYDPIARILRKMVRDENIKKKIMVVASTEIPKKNETKVVGSTAYVPSVAGLLCASYVVNECIKDEIK